MTYTHVPADKEFGLLISDVMVGAVMRGLRSKHEVCNASTFVVAPVLLCLLLSPLPLLQFARRESFSVLSQLVKTYPSWPLFSELRVLTHKDAEVDFFENVHHIQLHRRTKALRRLATACREGTFSLQTATKFVLPTANQASLTLGPLAPGT